MPPPYPIGTRVYKEFPTFGWFWGTVTSCFHDHDEHDYYYDIQYTDGDCETLDHHEIAVVIQSAMRAEKKENEPTTVVAVSSSGGDDDDVEEEEEDDTEQEEEEEEEASGGSDTSPDDSESYDSDIESDTRKKRRRSPRRAVSSIGINPNKRPRRSVSYRGRYGDDDHDHDVMDEQDDEVEEKDDARSVTPDLHHDTANMTPRRIVRPCRSRPPEHHPPSSSSAAKRRASPPPPPPSTQATTKTTKASKATKPTKVTKLNTQTTKTKVIRSKHPPNGTARKPTTNDGRPTTTSGIYDKAPYSGGQDLEVISDIQHMFDDMIGNTLLTHHPEMTTRLCDLLQKCRQRGPIRLATMCSGTESPILALDLIQNALHEAARMALTNSNDIGSTPHEPFGQFLSSLSSSSPRGPHDCPTTATTTTVASTSLAPSSVPWDKLLPIQHVFSCEIEPYKQAYIERNFSPPILFRDIRELGRDQAYTAYGALVDVPNTPGTVDLLIAGTSCVDYSNLNNQKKNMEEKGESGATFYGMLRWIEKAKPPLVIIENVYGAPWNDKVKLFEERGYAATFIRLDTKDYYIPHTRQRGYLFAVRNHNHSNSSNNSKKIKGPSHRPKVVDDPRPLEWTNMVTALKRPASASVDDFMLPNDDPRVLRGRARLTDESQDDTSSSRAGRVDWTKCETRHLTARSLEDLGDQRPLTGWSESGRTILPSFCWNEWCNSQVHRIHDLMDINTLRLAKVGIDATYKTMVWNLSQNVDRDTMGKLGLCQCLTPTGVPYVTNRGGPLVGEELLMLQGIPVDDLLLTKETEDNLKDLAGNAMSTTVVGACALCALLVGQDALFPHDEVLPDSGSQILPSLVPRPLEPWSEIRVSRQFGSYEELSVDTSTDVHGEPRYSWESFLLDACWSAKMCVSETEDEVLPLEMIAECKVCGHTSSTSNAYPPRKYEEHEYSNVTSCLKRVNPVDFRRRVLSVIPMRVSITGIEVDDIDRPASINPDLWGDWKDSVRPALVSDTGHPVEFRFTELKRAHEWTALYESQSMARLEVKISKRGVVWLLFAKPPTRQCFLRKILDRPIARLNVSPFLDGSFSISAGKWQVCIPLTQSINVNVAGVGEQLPSWRNRLGLKGAFENEIQYETLRITLDSSDSTKILDLKAKVDGDYKLLPKCGGACGSLRRKIPESGDDDDVLYFYLASNRSTLSCDDPYVISHSFHRADDKEYRDICLELDRSYSPLFFGSGNSAAKHPSAVACSLYGCWLTVQNAMISENHSNNTVVRCPLQSLNMLMSTDGWKSCPELLTATFPINKDDDIVTKCLNLGGAVEVNLSKARRVLKHVAFALSKWTLPNLFDNKDWLMLSDEGKHDNVELLRSEECAPVKPQIKWTLISKGKRATYIPLEDVKQAAVYERALKARPKPWLLRISASVNSCDATASMTIQIGCNVVSVVQRALGLLPLNSMAQRCYNEICLDSTKQYSFEWRIVHHIDSMFNFPKLTFTSNKKDVEALQPPRFSTYGLRKEQLRSLTWMLKQESSTEPFHEEEVAEAVFPCLNWRIEGRVRRPVLVRGGIIADEVGYGKTAITLGLIDSAEAVNGQAPLPPSDFQGRYLYTKATLIIVPKHLMGQWPDEVSKFLGKSKNVCVIKDLTAYNKLTIADLQSADMVIVSFAVINSETYFTRLARLSGINPENFPNGNGSSRHFARVYADCVNALPTQVEKIMRDTSKVYSCIDQAAQSFESHHVSDIIHLDGKKSIYKSSKNITKGQIPRVKLASSDVDPWELSSIGVKKNHLKMKCPPLEAFFWQRMVVDEFTYLASKDREHVLEVVSNIHCTFQWFLSGTPKHANFNDISTLAALLGVHLGIDEVLPGVKMNKKYLTNNNNSGLESLSHYLESRSVQWHFRRHKLSQSFLDRFVRQNVAEIDEIPYREKMCMISLPAVERAIYMELETHLKSLEMNCMTAQKSKRKSTGDRESRMQKILEDSDSGEEALLKCCCHFNMSSSFTALETIDDIIALRQSEKNRLEKEMVQSLASAFRQKENILCHQPDWRTVTVTGKGEIHDALQVFTLDVDAMKSVPHGADIEINDSICTLVAKGRHYFESNPSEVCGLDDNDDDAVDDATIFEMKHALRNHMHFVRSLTKELCGRMRSLRYIQNIRQFQLTNKVFKCPMCGVETSGTHHFIGVLSCCGHAGCIECLSKHANEGRCIIPDCCARVSASHIASTDRLGVNNAMCSGRFGRKLTSVVQKVQEILSDGNDDRVIIFCQFDDLKSLVANALDASNIQSLQVRGTVTQQINTLTIFQKDIPEKDDPRVLLLKMDDEQSAGLNLTNLNHAIFLHPLLATSQEEYDAYETQAIGRIRRYGQKKTVFCWRFFAEDSIDTEIHEQRKKHAYR